MIETKLYASVNLERLLPEVPRFFPGFEAVLAEILQNAHRSKATEVHVTHDPEEGTLTFLDNGIGLDTPAQLLNVGDVGWNESEVVDPAGMGAFAALRPEYVKQVDYESHGGKNWRLVVTPEILTGGAAILTDVSANDWTGFSVKLHLAEDTAYADFPHLLRKSRGYYPFKLIFQERGGGENIIEPYYEWRPDLSLELPQGRFEWHHNRYRYSQRHDAVWEYRPIESWAVKRALDAAAKGHPHSEFAQALVNSSYRWFVDPSSGVRPKLPDRNEILEDATLQKASEAIVGALVEWMFEFWRGITSDWPRCIDLSYASNDKLLPDDLSWFCYEDRLARHILPALGWKRVEYVVPADTMWHADDEGNGCFLSYDEGMNVYYDRDAIVIGSESLALTLNLQGFSTSRAEGAPDPAVLIRGFRGNSKRSPYVAFTDQILLSGTTLLPWLLIPDTSEHPPWNPSENDQGYSEQSIIFAGGVQEFIKAMHRNPMFVNVAALQAMKTDFPERWTDWEDGEPDFDPGEAMATIAVQVTQAFAPDLLPIRERYYSIFRLLGQLNKAVSAMRIFTMMFADHVEKQSDPISWLLQPPVRLLHAGLLCLHRLLVRHKRRLGRRASIPPGAE